MAISAAALGPRLAIAAVVGYCVWPSVYVMVSPPTMPAPTKPPELAESLLSPKMTDLPVRNVFLTKQDGEALVKNSEQASAKKQSVAATKRDGKRGGLPGGKPPGELLAGLKLEATYISGNVRMAIINGRVYGVKETISAGNGPKMTIVDVRPEEVLLACEGASLALHYVNQQVGGADAGVKGGSASRGHAKSGK